MERAKLVTILFLSASTLTTLLLLGALYLYDPLQLFHKPWGRPVTFGKNMRQQAPGIIRNYNGYDGVILGTCMLENTSSADASRILGGHFINLSIADGTFTERAMLMKQLFRRHSIRSILYSLDVRIYLRQLDFNRRYPKHEFAFLYDDDPGNDIRAYLNDRYLSCLLTFSTDERCVGTSNNLDRPNAWFNKEVHRQCYGGLDHWIRCAEHSKATRETLNRITRTVEVISRKDPQSVSTDDTNRTLQKIIEYFETNLLSFIHDHPRTKFILIDPPYSRIQYAIWAQRYPRWFALYLEILKYLARQSDHYRNLEVYSFGLEPFVDDISRYKDMIHYDERINRWILRAVAEKRGLLQSTNVENYLHEIAQRAKNYNLKKLEQTIIDLQKKVSK